MSYPSWPGLTQGSSRPSISASAYKDGRAKPGTSPAMTRHRFVSDSTREADSTRRRRIIPRLRIISWLRIIARRRLRLRCGRDASGRADRATNQSAGCRTSSTTGQSTDRRPGARAEQSTSGSALTRIIGVRAGCQAQQCTEAQCHGRDQTSHATSHSFGPHDCEQPGTTVQRKKRLPGSRMTELMLTN